MPTSQVFPEVDHEDSDGPSVPNHLKSVSRIKLGNALLAIRTFSHMGIALGISDSANRLCAVLAILTTYPLGLLNRLREWGSEYPHDKDDQWLKESQRTIDSLKRDLMDSMGEDECLSTEREYIERAVREPFQTKLSPRYIHAIWYTTILLMGTTIYLAYWSRKNSGMMTEKQMQYPHFVNANYTIDGVMIEDSDYLCWERHVLPLSQLNDTVAESLYHFGSVIAGYTVHAMYGKLNHTLGRLTPWSNALTILLKSFNGTRVEHVTDQFYCLSKATDVVRYRIPKHPPGGLQTHVGWQQLTEKGLTEIALDFSADPFWMVDNPLMYFIPVFCVLLGANFFMDLKLIERSQARKKYYDEQSKISERLQAKRALLDAFKNQTLTTRFDVFKRALQKSATDRPSSVDIATNMVDISKRFASRYVTQHIKELDELISATIQGVVPHIAKMIYEGESARSEVNAIEDQFVIKLERSLGLNFHAETRSAIEEVIVARTPEFSEQLFAGRIMEIITQQCDLDPSIDLEGVRIQIVESGQFSFDPTYFSYKDAAHPERLCANVRVTLSDVFQAKEREFMEKLAEISKFCSTIIGLAVRQADGKQLLYQLYTEIWCTYLKKDSSELASAFEGMLTTSIKTGGVWKKLSGVLVQHDHKLGEIKSFGILFPEAGASEQQDIEHNAGIVDLWIQPP